MTYEAVPSRPQTTTASQPLGKLGPIETPEGADTVNLRLQLPGDEWATIQVPAWGDLAESDVLQAATDAIHIRRLLTRTRLARSPRFWWSVMRSGLGAAEPVAWTVLPGDVGRKARLKAIAARALREAIVRAAPTDRSATSSLGCARAQMEAMERAAVLRRAADAPSTESPDPLEALDPTRDPQAYFETLFEVEDPWDYTNAYETLKYQQTLSLVPEGLGRAMEVACAEGHFTALLSPKVSELLAVDISSKALARAAKRCASFPNIAYQQFNLVTDAFPEPLDLIVCSEVLYYLGGEPALRKVARRMADALAPGGRLLTAHAFQLTDDPSKTGFDWGDPYGAETISRVFSETEGLTLERSIVTELYRIDLFRRGGAAGPPELSQAPVATPLDEGVERHVIWGGAVARRADLARSRRTFQVPVLMYHRIAEDGPPGLADYRVSAAAFGEQLRLLRRHGFHSVTPEEVMSRFERGRPLAGRPVMITFDDGYQDFADVAWPLLKRNDFSAHVFVVTNLVGQQSHWDSQFGPAAPLMDWETIRSLAKEGVSFGSHLATHRAADTLTSNELLQEAYGSRLRLEAELGRPVRSVAAPFGIYDERLLYVLRLAGYQSAFTTDEGMASITDDPHCFPRIEVAGGLGLDAFAAAAGLGGDG